MKKYRVGIEISGYVERCVEAEDGGEAQDIVLDSIDWDDVEFSCEECEEIKDNSRKKYKIKAEKNQVIEILFFLLWFYCIVHREILCFSSSHILTIHLFYHF